MLNRFLTFINEQQLLEPHQKTLLTVSGGIDSMVLATLFWQAKLLFEIAHCNFGLRAEESDGDELFVKQWAEQRGIHCFTKRFETTQFANSKGISIQMAARELRYEWFEELRQTKGFDFIATAHHQNDVVETVLFNLVRGTGIAGLHGIKPKNGVLIRPLLFMNRTEIEAFSVDNQVLWREDSSNVTDHYHRNLLRNKVIPILKEINPNLEKTLMQTVEKLAATETIFKEAIELTRQTVWQENEVVFVDFQALRSMSVPTLRLFELIKKFGFNYHQCQAIVASFDTQAGKHFETATHTLVRDRQFLMLKERSVGTLTTAIGNTDHSDTEKRSLIVEISKHQQAVQAETMQLKMSLMVVKEWSVRKFPANQLTAYFDDDKLVYPLVVRKWQIGDWFCPFGMGGKRKKISDLLIDKKISVWEKENVWVLTSDNQIAWVIGLRTDERFKVSDQSQRILEIEIGS